MYCKVCSTSYFERRHWHFFCPLDLRGLEHCSTIDYLYFLPHLKLYYYLELNLISVLPYHRIDLTSSSAPIQPYPPHRSYLTTRSSYLRALLNTAALPKSLRTDSSALMTSLNPHPNPDSDPYFDPHRHAYKHAHQPHHWHHYHYPHPLSDPSTTEIDDPFIRQFVSRKSIGLYKKNLGCAWAATKFCGRDVWLPAAL